ncbi:hypothetical protein ABH894_005447, partial [Paenibacillus sp. RC62]
ANEKYKLPDRSIDSLPNQIHSLYFRLLNFL